MTHSYIIVFSQIGDGDVLYATSGQFRDKEEAREAVLNRDYVREVVVREVVAIAEDGNRLHQVIPPTKGRVTSIPWKGVQT